MDQGHDRAEERKRREERKKRRLQYMKRIHFKHYIRRLFVEFGGDISLSSDAVDVINDTVLDLFHQLATEAKELMVYAGTRTLMVSDVKHAALLIFKGGIADHAVANAWRSVLHYIESTRRR